MEAWLTITLACIGSAGFFSFLQFLIMRKDKTKENTEDIKRELFKIYAQIEQLKSAINKQAQITKIVSDSTAYIIDGLEDKHIMNGEGSEHLRDINEFYKMEGYNALIFHSVDEKKTRRVG